MKRKSLLLLAVVVVLALTGCQQAVDTGSPAVTSTSGPVATQPAEQKDTTEPTATPAPTATSTVAPTATNTPAPTATSTPTPAPTNTPTPTPTNTPTPTPTNTPTPTPTNTPTPTPTNTPTPKPTNTPTPTPSPKPKYTYKEMNKTMYASSSVNVRELPSTEGKKLGKLTSWQEVSVTGQCNETGWYRIDFKGKTGFVSESYLTSVKPTPTPTPVPETDIKYFAWEQMADGNIKINGLKSGYPANIVIPTKIYGFPVTEISSKAFSNCGNLESMLFSNVITRIGEDIFEGCDKLKLIIAPEGSNAERLLELNGYKVSNDISQ